MYKITRGGEQALFAADVPKLTESKTVMRSNECEDSEDGLQSKFDSLVLRILQLSVLPENHKALK